MRRVNTVGCDRDRIWFDRDNLARPAYPDGVEAAPVVLGLLQGLAQEAGKTEVEWKSLMRAGREAGHGPLNVLAGLALLEARGSVSLSGSGSFLRLSE